MSQLTNILLEAGTNELEVVEFFIEEKIQGADGNEEIYQGNYGINVAKVLEIINLPDITALPGQKNPAVMGAFNLRDKIIPLIDLCSWLGKKRQDSVSPKVIVTEFNQVVTAFLVSGVNRIHRISWEAVAPPSDFVAAMHTNCITGTIHIQDHLTLILDLEKIITEFNPVLSGLKQTDTNLKANSEYHALIADDSLFIQNIIATILRNANFKVTATNNGRECLNTLLETKALAQKEDKQITDYFQIVISDIEMPAMDGHNLTKNIKDDPFLAKLPVILFSSIITDSLRHKGEAVGANAQLSKPELANLVKLAIKLVEGEGNNEKENAEADKQN